MHIKSKLAIVLGVGLSGLFRGAIAAEGIAQKNGDLIAKIHFVGTTQIAADPNAAKLNEIWALPESGELWKEVLRKLSTTPFRVMNRNSPERKDDHAALLRPLAEDFLQSESYLEIRRTTNAWAELAVAVRLDKKRTADWRDVLSKVLTDWTGIPVKETDANGFKGWELRKHHNPNVFRFFQAGDWVVFGWGQDELSLLPGILDRIKEKQRPIAVAKEYWLDAWMDWPALTVNHPVPLPFKLPKMQLTVAGKPGNIVRPELKLQFEKPLGLKLEPWRIPTNTIYDPISSITFMRGFAPLLDENPEVVDLKVNPLPNQLVYWAMQRIPFETCVAAPVTGASNYLERVAPGLVPRITAKLEERNWSGAAEWTTNKQIKIKRMPFIVPFLQAIHEPAGDFLIGGIFALPPRANPAPWDSILKPITPTNVVYYDWELNGERLDQWRPLSQLYFMTTARMLPKIEAVGQKWIRAIKPKLDNCGTVGTLSAPNELTIIRNSRLGLTGFELTCLVLWMDAPGFPLEANVESSQIPNPKGPPAPKK